MEQSAFEAVMTGVNVFVFIVALSAGILLMSSVIDMVNFANDRAIVGMNGTLAENVGVVNERVYTGAQMLNYYREIEEAIVRCPHCKGEIAIDTTECPHCGETINTDEKITDYKYNFYVRLDELGQERLLKNYIESESLRNYLNEKFILEYKGEEQGKHTYVFSKVQNENTEI